MPGFDVALRYGFVAPAGTPRPIIDRLNREMRAALASEDVIRRLAVDGAEPIPSPPEEYAADIDREETTWSKVVKAIGLRGDGVSVVRWLKKFGLAVIATAMTAGIGVAQDSIRPVRSR